MRNFNPNLKNLRVIKTARNLPSINIAVMEGFRPLVKPVEPSPDIHSKVMLVRNKNTGEFSAIGDYRSEPYEGSEYEAVTGWIRHYPYRFEAPFAAYLIPEDINIGERVYIEDLIEDYLGASWNQGDTFRLPSCEAVWTGTELDIQYDPEKNVSRMMG